jgi:hypothetical protein
MSFAKKRQTPFKLQMGREITTMVNQELQLDFTPFVAHLHGNRRGQIPRRLSRLLQGGPITSQWRVIAIAINGRRDWF